MAGPTRNDGESSEAVGIPTGLNRIKTRITSSSNDNIQLSSSNFHSKSIASRFKQNHQRSFSKGFVKLHSSKEGAHIVFPLTHAQMKIFDSVTVVVVVVAVCLF